MRTPVGTQWVDVATEGLDVPATVASTLVGPAGTPVEPVPSADPLTARHDVRLQVQAGQAYEVTKYVGVATGTDSGDPHQVAVVASRREADDGYTELRGRSDAAWAALWRSDVVVSGDPRLGGTPSPSSYHQ